jgi:hypothetical protein
MKEFLFVSASILGLANLLFFVFTKEIYYGIWAILMAIMAHDNN